MLMQPPDVLRAALRGNLAAFNRMALDYQELGYNLAYRVLCDEAAAAQVVEKAFLSLYQDLPFKHMDYSEGQFELDLLRAIVRGCLQGPLRIRWLPSRSRNGNRGKRSSQPEGEIPAEPGERTIMDCLRGMPPGLRLVLALVDVLGFNYEQTASILEISADKVRRRLAQARQMVCSALIECTR